MNNGEYSSADRQYSNDNIWNQDSCTDIKMDLRVRSVDKGENFQEQNSLYDRLGNDTLSSNPTIKIDYEFSKLKLKDVVDSKLDEIDFSDDEKNDQQKKAFKDEHENLAKLYLEEADDSSMTKYTGTKHEKFTPAVTPSPYEILPEHEVVSIGIINSIENNKIIVQANTDYGVLDLDNVVFNSNNHPVGYIDEVFGKVDNPYYVINTFPIDAHLKLHYFPETKLFAAFSKLKLVNKEELVRNSGTDASNAYDEEVDAKEADYSDDERERSVKKTVYILFRKKTRL